MRHHASLLEVDVLKASHHGAENGAENGPDQREGQIASTLRALHPYPAYGAPRTRRDARVHAEQLRSMRRSADQSRDAGVPLVLPSWLQWDQIESG